MAWALSAAIAVNSEPASRQATTRDPDMTTTLKADEHLIPTGKPE
jgi:hypothetical protein